MASSGLLALLAVGGGAALVLIASKKSSPRAGEGVPALPPKGLAPTGIMSLPGVMPGQPAEGESGEVKAALAHDLWGDGSETREAAPPFAGLLGESADLTRLAATSQSLPEGTTFAAVYGAPDPLRSHVDRVTFELLRSGERVGVLEGIYVGGGDTDKPGEVVVDRIAHRLLDFPLGTYSVPAGKSAKYSSVLERVRWEDVDPTTEGLSGFEKPPLVEVGDKAMLLVRDRYGTTAVVTVLVRKVGEGGALTVSLFSPYRMVKDAGSGAPALSAGRLPLSQALIETSVSQLVNPKSLV